MVEKRRLVSIVVPMLNEQECLPRLHEELSRCCDSSLFEFEFIFVDDGSTDETPNVLSELREQDSRVRFVLLSRNFGHQAALTAGLDIALGEAVIMMDGDLQHPPDVIPRLIEKWEQGFDVVHTVRKETADAGIVKRLFSSGFYRVFNMVSGMDIQPGSADFRLISRQVLNELNRLPERQKFLRGLVPWLGFEQTSIEFDAPERFAGRTSYTFARNIRFALDGITSFSFYPLRRVIVLGWLTTLFSAGYAMFALGAWILTDKTVPGWTSLLLCITFFGGCHLLTTGLIGEYVGRIYHEIKQRPVYIVRETHGFAEHPAVPTIPIHNRERRRAG